MGGPEGGPEYWLYLERLISEFKYRKQETEETKSRLRGGYETISEFVLACASKGEGNGDKGKGECVEVDEDEMDWNDRVCFLESLKAELSERRQELKELHEVTSNLIHRKGGEHPSNVKGVCEITKLDHDNGENDGLEIVSEGKETECKSETSREDSNSEDKDYFSNDDEFSVDKEDDDCEDEEEEDLFNELGPNDNIGPIEETMVHEEGAFFMVGNTFGNKHELVRAINNYAIKNGVKLKFVKSKPLRVRVLCQKGYPFVLYASKEGSNLGLIVKTLDLEHRCSRVFKNLRATVK